MKISKTEIAGSEEIPGCELEITEKDTDTVIESWTSTKKKHIIEQKYLLIGHLREGKAVNTEVTRTIK